MIRSQRSHLLSAMPVMLAAASDRHTTFSNRKSAALLERSGPGRERSRASDDAARAAKRCGQREAATGPPYRSQPHRHAVVFIGVSSRRTRRPGHRCRSGGWLGPRSSRLRRPVPPRVRQKAQRRRTRRSPAASPPCKGASGLAPGARKPTECARKRGGRKSAPNSGDARRH